MRYMLIWAIRKVRPTGESERQWVYDGAILETPPDGSIRVATGISCVLERDIRRVVV